MKARTVSGRFWKCPKCGRVLRKTLLRIDMAKLGVEFPGKSTCVCGASFPLAEVYSGVYDVTVQIEIPTDMCPLRTHEGYCKKSKDENTGKFLYVCRFADGNYVLDCTFYDSEYVK